MPPKRGNSLLTWLWGWPTRAKRLRHIRISHSPSAPTDTNTSPSTSLTALDILRLVTEQASQGVLHYQHDICSFIDFTVLKHPAAASTAPSPHNHPPSRPPNCLARLSHPPSLHTPPTFIMAPRKHGQAASWEVDADKPKPEGSTRIRRSYITTKELTESECFCPSTQSLADETSLSLIALTLITYQRIATRLHPRPPSRPL